MSQCLEKAPKRAHLVGIVSSAFTIKNLLRHYAKWLNGDLNKEKVLVGAFSGHCETLRRILDTSIRWRRQRAADWRAVGGVIDWLGEIGRTFDNISRI